MHQSCAAVLRRSHGKHHLINVHFKFDGEAQIPNDWGYFKCEFSYIEDKKWQKP